MGCDAAGEKETSGGPLINGLWFNSEYVEAQDRWTHSVMRVSTPNIEMWAGWSGDYDSRCRAILSVKWVNSEEVEITGPGGLSGRFKTTFHKDENSRDYLNLLPVGANPAVLVGLTLDGEAWGRLTLEQFNSFQFSDNPDCAS